MSWPDVKLIIPHTSKDTYPRIALEVFKSVSLSGHKFEGKGRCTIFNIFELLTWFSPSLDGCGSRFAPSIAGCGSRFSPSIAGCGSRFSPSIAGWGSRFAPSIAGCGSRFSPSIAGCGSRFSPSIAGCDSSPLRMLSCIKYKWSCQVKVCFRSHETHVPAANPHNGFL